MGPVPAVAAIRSAVRRILAPLPDDATVVVACSGGADSLALLAAAAFEGHKRGQRVVGVTVDHGLQATSAEVAAAVVAQMAGLGADETVTARVAVEAAGRGPEAAAREARYAVLGEVAAHTGAAVVLLGHTLDDQAETVLMGLARGSGGRSIAGMRRAYDGFARPLLDVTRAQTREACRAQDIDPWSDPHNEDPRFTRARVRHTVLPVLEAELGPGVAETLARTADQLQEDLSYLDERAEAAYAGIAEPTSHGVRLDLARLTPLHPAIRRRLLHRAALAAGVPGSELTRGHVLAVDALVTDWRGQVRIDLPGHRAAYRDGGLLHLDVHVGGAGVAG